MTQADDAIAFARAQLGKPYVFGATGPNAYDCSGLTYSAYKAAGVAIGRTTYQQIFNGAEVARADLAPGDLLFPDAGHVQLYVGNNMVVESPHSGAFVREQKVFGFWRARRVAAPGTSSPNGTPATPAGFVPVLDDPVTAALKAFFGNQPAVKTLEAIGSHLTDKVFLRRIGVALIGVWLIIFAIIFINRSRIADAGKAAVKVGEVAALA